MPIIVNNTGEEKDIIMLKGLGMLVGGGGGKVGSRTGVGGGGKIESEGQ